jgi:hypothetical protein
VVVIQGHKTDTCALVSMDEACLYGSQTSKDEVSFLIVANVANELGWKAHLG